MFGKTSEKELTSRIIDLQSGFNSIVANLDDSMDWLSDVGESVDVFDEMLQDGRVSSLVEQRQDKVLRLDMGQVDGDYKSADFKC